MYLIVGLGNPENEYANTRHNMGFDVINKIAQKNNIAINKSKFKALYETAIIQNKKVILVKPQTYMNSSGESVREIVEFYQINPDEIIIIYDDIDIALGKIKIRPFGSSGTHNGMRNIIANIKPAKAHKKNAEVISVRIIIFLIKIASVPEKIKAKNL